MHPRPKGDGRQSVSRDRRRRDRGAAQGLRNSLLAAPALQQRWPRPPPPPLLLSRRRPSSHFSPRAEALSERRRAPGGAFLLRHLLLLLLPQWRLHLPLVAASVPAPGRLLPRSEPQGFRAHGKNGQFRSDSPGLGAERLLFQGRDLGHLSPSKTCDTAREGPARRRGHLLELGMRGGGRGTIVGRGQELGAAVMTDTKPRDSKQPPRADTRL